MITQLPAPLLVSVTTSFRKLLALGLTGLVIAWLPNTGFAEAIDEGLAVQQSTAAVPPGVTLVGSNLTEAPISQGELVKSIATDTLPEYEAEAFLPAEPTPELIEELPADAASMFVAPESQMGMTAYMSDRPTAEQLVIGQWLALASLLTGLGLLLYSRWRIGPAHPRVIFEASQA